MERTLNWHSMRISEIMEILRTSPRGLSAEEAQRRLYKYGPNELEERRKVTPIKIFLDQFRSYLVWLLIFSSIISIIIEELIDASAIMAIVILNAILGFIQEYRAEKALEALKKLITPKARVRRGGKEIIISARDLVPGDIIILEPGDRVPADARLIKSTNLEVDEAMLTGESVPVTKNASKVLDPNTPLSDRCNMVYMGTLVTKGVGEGVVVSTGMRTEMGKIAEMVQLIEERKTPLMMKLDRFGKQMGVLIVGLCIMTFILGELRGIAPIVMFMTAVSLAVSAVPEGLPAIVTVTLALGVKEMSKRNAIVRRLASVETLGCTTVICADKTGTMTKNEMTIRRIYINDRIIEVTGSGYEPKGEFILNGTRINPLNDRDLSLLIRVGLLCNHAELVREGKTWRVIGDPTEGALVALAKKAGLERESELEKYPRIGEIPFESGRKRMTTIHLTPEGKCLVCVKGAPEIILKRCNRILMHGNIIELSIKERKKIIQVVQNMAANALRVLAIAYKELPKEPSIFDPEVLERELIFIGLVGMIDPPREEVKKAVEQCRRAGIKVIMLTGDHKLTAIAIAKEIGLIKSEKEGLVLTGEELEKISDEELERIVEDVVIFARVSPQHKVRIVRALKRRGHIVAMTGDGVNDAPALKMADIGIAMGIKGTDVAKEASDMILADDNFATIVAAVRSGREIYDNIRKFLRFLLACNFDEIGVITTSILTGLELPLLPLQILWINLVTDGGPALALSVDPPDPDIMDRPPRSPEEGILHGMKIFVFASALLQYLGTMSSFLLGMYLFGDPVSEARTLAFVQAILFELFVVFNCRSEKYSVYRLGLLTNKPLLISVMIGALSTIALVYLPPLQVVFETSPMTLQDWVLCIIMASGAWIVLPEIFIKPFNKHHKS